MSRDTFYVLVAAIAGIVAAVVLANLMEALA